MVVQRKIQRRPQIIYGGAGYKVTGTTLKKMKKYMTFNLPFGDTPEERRLEAFHVGKKGMLWVPRNLAPYWQDADRRDRGTELEFTSNFDPEYDPSQEPFIAESVALLNRGISHIACARTGFGKTYTGAEVIARMGLRSLILTFKEDLLDQWYVALKDVLQLEDSEIGLWRGDYYPTQDHKVVLGLTHSVCKGYDRYPEQCYRGYGLVIPDEVHMMPTKEFVKCMWYLPARLRYGLSATPNRKDGRTVLLRGHIGEVLVKSEAEELIPKVISVKTGWKVPRILKDGKVVQIPHKAGRTAHIEKIMAKNTERNQIAVDLLTSAYNKGRNIIVFTNTILQLKALHTMLVNAEIPAIHIGYYVGLDNDVYEGSQANRKAMRNVSKGCRIILATYKMAKTGTNIPRLDTCILMSPMSDVAQAVGRIRRRHPDKRFPVVFDLRDDDSKVFESYGRKRRQWYAELNAEVRHLS